MLSRSAYAEDSDTTAGNIGLGMLAEVLTAYDFGYIAF